MDARRNPFAPGAGTQPPELAGRENIIADAQVALARLKTGLAARSQMLLGLRGVGKTVLLNRMSTLATDDGYESVLLEAPEDRRLAEMLVPPLRSLLFRLSKLEKARQIAQRALGVLRAFASVFKVKVGDAQFGIAAEAGTADSGDLEADLPELLLLMATAAATAETPVALLVDEIQYLRAEDFAALVVAVHKINQKALPLIVFGAGLPMVAKLAGEAKSYAERLFDYPEVGALAPDAARDAINEPIRRASVEINDDALAFIIEKTGGYPYFLQEWGYHVWNTAPYSPITKADAELATTSALQRLDSGFFRVRFDRLTPREKEYMRAMAELGPGPHRSGDIAVKLGVAVTSAAPLRSGLIAKGMIYSPDHGDTAFTVPMFDEFMRRAMPAWPDKKRPK